MLFVGWIDQFGNMLDQSATESNLDYLQAAADAKYGPPRLEKPFKQTELHVVSIVRCAACLGMAGLAVADWINVVAAAQQQGVELLGRRKRLRWLDDLGGDVRAIHPVKVVVEIRAFSLCCCNKPLHAESSCWTSIVAISGREIKERFGTGALRTGSVRGERPGTPWRSYWGSQEIGGGAQTQPS